jgi:hypothetical protein
MNPKFNKVVQIPTKHTALAMLPKSYDTHWVARRKAQVVQAVQLGWLGLDEACRRYRLSEDEYFAWESAFGARGVEGLTLKRAERGAFSAQVH